MKLTKLVAATIVALGMAFGTIANAATLSSGDNTHNFSWSHDTGAGYDVSGFGTLTVTGFNSDSLTVTISLTNTSPNLSDRLTAFGFGIEPNATDITSFNSNVFADAYFTGGSNPSLPGLTGIEICVYSGNNCPGGANQGMPGQGSTSLTTLVLAGEWGDSVIIDPFGVRYQTEVGSFTFPTNGNGNGNGVPEPGTLALFGAGLLGFAMVRRRRKI